MLKSYYEILNIKEDATKDEIKLQFKKLAKMYHPDVNTSLEAENIFKEINRAATILLDDDKRRQYDSLRVKKYQNIKKEAYKNKDKKPKEDYFSNPPKKGKDIFVEVTIDEKEAILGTNRTINIVHSELCPKCKGVIFANGSKCPVCNGSGEIIQKRKITVKIPAFVKNKSKLRIKNEGNSGLNGGQNGNLYVEINIKENSKFQIKDGIVYFNLSISPYTAVLGGDVKVSTLYGFETIKIPPLTKSSQSFKLVEAGLVDKKTGKKGDEIVTVTIQIPSSITDEEYRLYEKLKEINLNKKNAKAI